MALARHCATPTSKHKATINRHRNRNAQGDMAGGDDNSDDLP
jgi:hypothetical protein